MSKVTKITVPPRVQRFKVGKHDVVVMYDPETGKWNWTAYITQTYKLHGSHSGLELAMAQAKKLVAKFDKENGEEV